MSGFEQNIYLIGGGGHAKQVIDILLENGMKIMVKFLIL